MSSAGRVVLIDLRTLDAAQARIHGQALLIDPGTPDLTRLLVVDMVSALSTHEDTYQLLLASRRLTSLLCVAVGALDRERRRLTLPAVIGAGQGAAVLWVGDPGGVDWPLSVSAAAISGSHSPADAGLGELLDLLHVPGVYDRVTELTGEIRGGVASPGLSREEPGAEQRALVSLKAELTRRAGREPDSPAAVPAASELPLVLAERMAESVDEPSAALLPGGPLAEIDRAARQSAEEAVSTVAALRTRDLVSRGPELVAAVMGATGATGSALQRYAQAVDTLTHVDPRPEARSARARQVGLRLETRPGPSRAEVAEGLGVYVAARLDERLPLAEVGARLLALRTALRPPGGERVRAELRRSCPPELVRSLTAPPPFPAPQPWLSAAGFGATMLAGLAGWVGAVVAAVLGLAWTVLVATAYAPSAGPGRARFGRVAAGGVLPTVAGGAVGVAAGLRFPVPFVVAVVAALVGLGLMLAAIAVSWRRRAAAWTTRLPVGAAAQAAAGLARAVARVSADWSRIEERSAAADAASRAASLVSGVRDGLTAVDVAPGPVPTDLDERGAAAYREIVVAGWLTELVNAVLAPWWAALTGAPAELRESARSETTDVLRRWHDRLAGEQLPLDGEPGPPARLREEVGPEVVRHVVDRAGGSVQGRMWQLITPPDLPALDVHAARVPAVRYVPALLQPALRSELPPDTTWTTGSLRVGILRLVPVRTENVVRQWSVDAGAAPADQEERLS